MNSSKSKTPDHAAGRVDPRITRRSALKVGAAMFVSTCVPTKGVSARELRNDEFAQVDGFEAARLVETGQVTPLELLDAAIRRIEAFNPQLNAIVTRMDDVAREAIRQGLPDGPFQGVPFLLKDLDAPYAGVRNTSGSKLFEDYIAETDSELVNRFKRSGLITCGRTNTPEFGLNVSTESKLFGPCRNPWDPDMSTGGSSGGSAAAVAASRSRFLSSSPPDPVMRPPISVQGGGRASWRVVIPSHHAAAVGVLLWPTEKRAKPPIGFRSPVRLVRG